MKIPPNAPALLIDQLLDARGEGNAARVSVEASTLGPASTLLILSETTKMDSLALLVQVRHHGVSMILHENDEFHHIGVGCSVQKDMVGSLAVMLRRPQDYVALQACLRMLRARLPTGERAHPQLTYFGSIPTAMVVYVANLLRCGERRCSEGAPRLWDVFGVSKTDEYGSLPDEKGPPFFLALQPPLRDCFTVERDQLTEPSYETEVYFTARTDVSPVVVDIQPGLPPSLHACAARVFRDAHLSTADITPGAITRIPLVFGE
jgi:hypothetical protein